MKAFYDEINKLMEEAKAVEPLLNAIKGVICNSPKNKYGQGVFYDKETFSGIKAIDWMYKWDEHPIVITVWKKPVEFIYDHILSALRFRYACTFEMDTWDSIQKVLFKTKINNIPVYIQLIDASECKWEEVQTTTYKLNCAA